VGIGKSMFIPAVILCLAALMARSLPCAQAPRGPNQTTHHRPTVTPSAASQKAVWTLIALSTAYFLAYGPFETVLPALIRQQLDAGPGVYSALWLLFGLGALATLPLAPRLARHRPGMVNSLGAVTWGCVMLPVTLLRDATAVGPLFLIGGAVWGPYTTVETTALQRWTPASQLGRVFGLQRALLLTAAPLGAAVGAAALDHASPSIILAASATGCTMAGIGAMLSGGLRRAP
jgi:hypothetical protein